MELILLVGLILVTIFILSILGLILVRVLAWMLVGALVGYLAGLITSSRRGFWQNVLVGILGSMIGTILHRLLGFGSTNFLDNLLLAVSGAVLFTYISSWLKTN